MRLLVVAVAVTVNAQAHLPFDFVATSVDVNGWPVNPRWGAQATDTNNLPDPYACPGLEPWATGLCTNSAHWIDQTTWKCPSTAFNYVWFPGHINFGGAVFTGTLDWGDHSGSDDDYNLRLYPPQREGLTASNPESLQLEFDSDETIDHFHTSWWDALHHAVDDGAATASAMLHGKEAIAFGVFGLDCVHDCSSELHPVFALAIHVSSDPNDDVWAIFVRNWGNEGYCSSGTEVLDDSISSFAFTIAHPGASDVQVTSAEFLCRGRGGAGPSVDLVPGQGAVVTFGFPPAREEERINGVLHLRWTSSPASRSFARRWYLEASRVPPEEPEARAWLWTRLMNASQREQYNRLRPHRDRSRDATKPKRLARAPVGKGRQVIKNVPDEERERLDRLNLELIRRIYGGNLPPL